MKQVLIRAGEAVVAEVPAPQAGPGNVLVRVEYSCISVGTEMAGVRMSGLPIYQRALKQPENVRRVLAMVREQGLVRTLERVRGKLAAGTPTGYSAAGVVIAVGAAVEGFSAGDRVACAGAGIANHAEFIDVPVNLAVRVPDELGLDRACTVTLGAIALQGVRRTQPTLGETVVVIGLGILGQMTAQMLAANGCRVIGVDLDASRIVRAVANGLWVGIDPGRENYVERVHMLTGGFGADAVVITAASDSHAIVSEAMQAARKKGRVVLVGDVGLNLNRADFYQKELDFLVSTSYGPGRYDPFYEAAGNDYPLPYVRWTENRNMQAYLDLLARDRVRLDNLLVDPFPIDRAGDAYASLRGEGDKPLMVLLHYPAATAASPTRVALRAPATSADGAVRVALVGASSFAQGVHLPNMQSLRGRLRLHAVMSRTGANARAVAEQYGASYCTSALDDVLGDPDVDLVMITSRHDLHGESVRRALEAGKHVFVEKPLTLLRGDLDWLRAFYRERRDRPLLMVGYNRRFSPAITRCRDVLARRATPMIVDYRMNAGYLPPDHWVHGAEGGGRNLGEACHIYDLFNALVGVPHESVHAVAIRPPGPAWRRNDNFVATLRYVDGSICTLTYTALGDKSWPKERMEVFADGKVVAMDDFREVKIAGGRHRPWNVSAPQKGQKEEIVALADALATGGAWPIALDDLLRTSEIAFEVEAQLTRQD